LLVCRLSQRCTFFRSSGMWSLVTKLMGPQSFLETSHLVTRPTQQQDVELMERVPLAKHNYYNGTYKGYGPGSVVGIATSYGLGGPGIESRWGARFSAPVQTGPRAHPATFTMGTGSFPGVKSGRGVTLTPHPRGRERVELYLY
jgi:hypothetical protein